jgi:ABC-2 type transport system permease protein
MELYFRYALLAAKGQLRYRSTFFLTAFGQFFVPFFVFAGMVMLFGRFGNLKGWTLPEAMLCFSVIHVSFSVSECFARGFDMFGTVLSNGEFDRILVRPRSTILQVLGSRFEYSRVGRLFLAIGALVWALGNLAIDWNPLRVATLCLMILGGIAIFSGIFMLGASLCFWTTEGLEIMNVFTDGGREMAQYPLTIYQDWVRKFFTFVIPFGCVNYLPLFYVLGKPGASPFAALAPLAGFLFLLPCALVWRRGVRRFRSTGS